MGAAGERGQGATEYVATLALVALVIAALVLASMDRRITGELGRVVCLIVTAGSEACEQPAQEEVARDDAMPCILEEEGLDMFQWITAFSVDVGGLLSWTKSYRVNDAGQPVWRVTLTGRGDLGLTFGYGANVDLSNGGGTGAGAAASGTLGVTGGTAGIWEFPSEGEADDFIDMAERYVAHTAAGAALGPIGGWIYHRVFDGDEWEAPEPLAQMYFGGGRYVIGGDLWGGNASSDGFGAVTYQDWADGSKSYGVLFNTYTLMSFGQPAASGAVGVDITVLARLDYDPDGNLQTIRFFTNAIGFGMADIPGLSRVLTRTTGVPAGEIERRLSRALREYSLRPLPETRASVQLHAALNLDDPAVRAEAEAWVDSVVGSGGGGAAAALAQGALEPDSLADKVDGLQTLLADHGQMTVDVYTGYSRNLQASAEASYGLRFGGRLFWMSWDNTRQVGWRWDQDTHALVDRPDCGVAVSQG